MPCDAICESTARTESEYVDPASASRAGPQPIPHPLSLFRQQPQRSDAEAPQRIMPTPINQRRVVIHEQPIVELGDLQQRSNAIGDVDRLPDQSVQVARLEVPGIGGLIGPTKLLELRG